MCKKLKLRVHADTNVLLINRTRRPVSSAMASAATYMSFLRKPLELMLVNRVFIGVNSRLAQTSMLKFGLLQSAPTGVPLAGDVAAFNAASSVADKPSPQESPPNRFKFSFKWSRLVVLGITGFLLPATTSVLLVQHLLHARRL